MTTTTKEEEEEEEEENNTNTTTISLVPFTADYIEIYASWFTNDPELYEQTATDVNATDWTFVQKEIERDERTNHYLIKIDRTNEIIGDVCVYEIPNDDDMDNEESGYRPIGELTVMIGDRTKRRKGLAKKAVEMMLEKVEQKFEAVVVKIAEDNQNSRKLFERVNGFVYVRDGAANVFGDVELRRETKPL
jgi:RimJ/RimL family protein N-acetyltransferase